MWGLYWVPIRHFESLGVPGAWPGLMMYLSTLLCLLPLVWQKREQITGKLGDLIQSGAFTGAAFGLFTLSLIHTDVVRAILLFYLTPIWGTILGVLFLSERLTRHRIVALICGVLGLFVVLGLEDGFPWPRNGGDWMALASGLAWAIGSMGMYRQQNVPVVGQMFAFVFGATLLTFASLPILSETSGAGEIRVTDLQLTLLAFASAAYMLPMIFLTVWPATILTPARVGMLLMTEVVVGVVSAALFAGEAFGLSEALGAILIFSAALIDLMAPTQASNHTD